jgi:hypothetical protein
VTPRIPKEPENIGFRYKGIYMDFVIILHERLAVTAWLFFLALGLWGSYRAIRGYGTDGNYLGAVAIGQIIFVIQVIIGGILWFTVGSGVMARPGIHILYGAFALVFLPFVYLVILRGDEDNRAQWIMAFCTLFMFGISLRLMETAVY